MRGLSILVALGVFAVAPSCDRSTSSQPAENVSAAKSLPEPLASPRDASATPTVVAMDARRAAEIALKKGRGEATQEEIDQLDAYLDGE